MICSFLSRYQWFRRWVGGRWELWAIPMCESIMWLRIPMHEPDDRYQPCSSGPRIAREDYPSKDVQ